MKQEELAELRITSYNADTGSDWEGMGNTFWIHHDKQDPIVILGGITLVRHIVAAQPRVIQRLLKERDEAAAEVERLRESVARLIGERGTIQKTTRERDEARANIEHLQATVDEIERAKKEWNERIARGDER